MKRRPTLFTAEICRCKTCGSEYPAIVGEEPESCCRLQPLVRTGQWAWWYTWGVDPVGPFLTETEARMDTIEMEEW